MLYVHCTLYSVHGTHCIMHSAVLFQHYVLNISTCKCTDFKYISCAVIPKINGTFKRFTLQ